MKINGVEVIEIVKTKIPEDKIFKIIYVSAKYPTPSNHFDVL
ncbi:hypothetical protein [Ureibacillus thermophilus]|nr:hypothetical protein [Ureibacillus thermophilus]